MTTSSTVSTFDGLGRAIRQARRDLGLTQAHAAGLSGVSPRLWNETEVGKRHQLGLDTLLRMMNTVGLDLLVASRRVAPPPVGPRQDAAEEER